MPESHSLARRNRPNHKDFGQKMTFQALESHAGSGKTLPSSARQDGSQPSERYKALFGFFLAGSGKMIIQQALCRAVKRGGVF
jgi:hypothetical protein